MLALGLLGGPAIAQAYTVKSTDSGATVRWHTPAVTLRLDPSMQSYFKEMAVRDVVTHAADAWHDLPGVPELLISEGLPGTKGYESKSGTSNGVYLVEDWQLAESSLAVTVATFETKSGKIVDTDILVNAKHPFALLAAGPDGPSDDFDIRGVLTHEMGHVLGLGESYDVRLATMWPNVARGETHQRDLDDDDIDGVQTAYAMATASDTTRNAGGSSGGCGGASVVARRTHGPSALMWILAGTGLVIAGLWMRMRSKQGRGRAAPMFAMVLLFGAPFKGEPSDPNAREERVEVLRTLALRRLPVGERRVGLSLAARSTSEQVRRAAAAVLERVGTREDGTLAAALTLDADSEVRRVAGLAVERLRTAPPTERVAPEEPKAAKRLASLLDGASDIVQGEAVRTGARLERGLVWTKYVVHDDQKVVEVEIPGGELGDVTQVVSEHETPSTEGNELIIATQDRGRHKWAFVRDGVIYGGNLGDGPAIQWEN